jgi:TP901 family phage tail tape measure protein
VVEKVVAVRVEAHTEGAVAGFRKLKGAVDDVTKAASPKKADAFKNLSDKAALAGVGIAAAMGLAAKRFADFDQSMSAVKANSGATGKELEGLRSLAVKLGADSQFSAKEAADGINEMAKAGVSAQEIMGGGLKGALDLAAAGQIGVADAAETAATAMTQFKLKGTSVPHIADLLANAANKAQGGVGDMAQALKQAGLVASSTGLSIEETTAGLTAFASAGLIGSDAGTSFKTMLQRLSAPSGEAAAQMKTLGISAYDAQGNFVGLANLAGQLQAGMRDLTPEQRNAAQAIIFGNDAIRAANVLYDQGTAGINKWTDAVSEQGAAAKQAAALTDNLKGDLERLGGALDSVFIQTGSSANGGLRAIVQGAEGLVGAVGKIPGPLLIAGGALASFAALAPKGILKYRDYKEQLDAVGLSLDKISAKAPRTGRALETAAGALKAYAIAYALLQATVAATDNGSFGPTDDIADSLTKSTDAVKAFDAAVKDSSNNKFFADGDVQNFGQAVKDALNPDPLSFFQDKVAGVFGDVIPTKVKQGNDALAQLDTILTSLVQSEGPKAAAAQFDQFAQASEKQGVSVDKLRAKLPQYAAAAKAAGAQSEITGKAVAGLGKVTEAAAGQMATATAEGDATASAMLLLGENADAATDAVKNLAKTIQGDMDAASQAFQSSFDVLGKFDPSKQADAVKKAQQDLAKAEQAAQNTREKQAARGKLSVAQQQQLAHAEQAIHDATGKKAADRAKAEQRLSDLRARLGSKGSQTVAGRQSLDAASQRVADARKALADAQKAQSDASLGNAYKDTLAKARAFTHDITEVTKRGLDPNTVAKLLQEGPEKAAPALEALLGKNSRNLIQMSNDAETELRKINGVVVEQARLTSLAVNASNDKMSADLPVAMAIAAQKAHEGGIATGQEIAKGIGASLPEVQRIAAEFGITLQIPSPRPARLTVDNKDGLAAIREVRQELANADGMVAHTRIEVRIAETKARQEEAANSNTAGTLIPQFHRADGGRIPGYSPHARADNILVAATAGEFMIRKAAADSLGKATLDYLNRYGRLPERHADGGAVAARLAPIRLAPSLSSTRSSSDGFGRGFLTGSLDLGDGLTGRIQAVAQSDEAARSRRGNRVSL